MTFLFNQYSYIVISLGVVLVLLIALWRLRVRRAYAASVLLVVAALLVGGWLVFHPGSSDVDNVSAAENLLSNGKPTFLEFFSNYCFGCVAAKPVVDDLVSDIKDQYNVLRVDIHTDFGRDLRERYNFSYSPEFILFNSSGQEVWRSHAPPSTEQLSLASTS